MEKDPLDPPHDVVENSKSDSSSSTSNNTASDNNNTLLEVQVQVNEEEQTKVIEVSVDPIVVNNVKDEEKEKPVMTNQASVLIISDENKKTELTLSPPDGLRAWIVVLGSFIAHFVCLGVLYSFAIFILPYEKELGVSRATISLVYTSGLGMFFVSGVVAGRLADRLGTRPVFSIGIVLWTTAVFGASFSNSLGGTTVTHGILLGMGTSFCYFPAITVLPMWFVKRRSLAVGIAVLGSGLGSLTVALVGQTLIDTHGFRFMLRVVGGLGFGLLLIALACLRRRLPRENKGGLFADVSIFKDRNYRLILCVGFLFQFAFMIPYVHLAAYAADFGINPVDASLAVGFFGIGSSVGRVLLSFAGDYFGAIQVMRISLLSTGITMCLWTTAYVTPTLTAFAFFYGFFSGGFIASNPVVLADFFGPSKLGGLMGYQNLFMIPGALAGAPLAGYVYDVSKSYQLAALIGGGLMLFSGLLMFLLDLSKLSSRQAKLLNAKQQKQQQLVVATATVSKDSLQQNQDPSDDSSRSSA